MLGLELFMRIETS